MSQKPFNKEEYIKTLKASSLGLIDGQIERNAQIMADKLAFVKNGDDVVHLDYFYGILDENDLKRFEAELDTANLKLSYFDKNSIIFNSIDDYTLHISLFLSYPIVKLLGEGILTNVVWEIM